MKTIIRFATRYLGHPAAFELTSPSPLVVPTESQPKPLAPPPAKELSRNEVRTYSTATSDDSAHIVIDQGELCTTLQAQNQLICPTAVVAPSNANRSVLTGIAPGSQLTTVSSDSNELRQAEAIVTQRKVRIEQIDREPRAAKSGPIADELEDFFLAGATLAIDRCCVPAKLVIRLDSDFAHDLSRTSKDLRDPSPFRTFAPPYLDRESDQSPERRRTQTNSTNAGKYSRCPGLKLGN